MQDLQILINPLAGGGKAGRLLPALQDWARARTATLHVGQDIASTRAWLEQLPRGSTVALVGGDGTINQLLPSLVTRQLCLAVVAQGSGNDVARALGVAHLRWDQALDLARNGVPQPMDIGWLHTGTWQRPFLSSLTVGFDSAVGYKALHGPRWLRGLPRYLLATVRELCALQTWDMQLTLDGAPLHHGVTLFASTLNTPSYGSGIPAVPHARIDDGLLDVLVAGRFNTLQALAMLPRLLLARHLNHPRVHTRRFQTLQIRGEKPLPLATDGEYVGEARELGVQVAPAALQVIRA